MRFDLERWRAQFPLSSLRSSCNLPVEGYAVASPVHLAIIEQVRELVSSQRELPQGVPTEVFVFGRGEPEDPACTKIGGCPYRPATSPWPRTHEGRPLTFIAQFNFAESAVRVPDLPGEVLLVFGSEQSQEWPLDSDPNALVFEWQNRNVAHLLRKADIPRSQWRIPPLFGVGHATVDYPNAAFHFADFDGNWRIAVLEGLKIGGVPAFIQERSRPSGRFLCAIGSVTYIGNCPYPWVNQEEPVVVDWMSIRERERILEFGDQGIVNLFLSADGNVQWTFDSY